MVLNQNEYTMASLGYKLSYTTLITPNQTEPSPPYNTKTDGPPSIFSISFIFLTFDFSPSLADRRRARGGAGPPPPPSNHFSLLTSPPPFLHIFRRSSSFPAGFGGSERWLTTEHGKPCLFFNLFHTFNPFNFVSLTLPYFGFLFGLNILVADFRRATRRPAVWGPFFSLRKHFAHSTYLNFCDLSRL